MKRSLVIASLVGAASINAQAMDVAGVNVNGEANLDYASFSNGRKAETGFGDVTHDQFNLNHVQLRLAKDTEKFSFAAQLFWLPNDTQTLAGGSADTAANTRMQDNIYKLEMFYKPMANLAIGGGRMITTLGFESVNRSENKNYSNTIAFGAIVPGVYEGVRLKYAVPDVVTTNLSVYNRAAADTNLGEDNRNKAYELSATGKASIIDWFAGALVGTDKDSANLQTERKTYNAWVSASLIENMSLAVSFDQLNTKAETTGAEDKKVTSLSAILGYQLGDHGLALRYETVSDDKFVIASGAGSAVQVEKFDSITLTDKITLDPNLFLNLEYRMDTADKEYYAKDDGTLSKTANAFIIGASAHF